MLMKRPISYIIITAQQAERQADRMSIRVLANERKKKKESRCTKRKRKAEG